MSPAKRPIRLLLVDDHQVVLVGLRTVLHNRQGITVVGEAASKAAAVREAMRLKPDVILFGEQLPQAAWFKAQRDARQCDLMLVAGSSLEVLPVAGLPMQALDRGAHLIIINNTPTYLNIRADVAILDDVAAIIPAITERVIKWLK